jgi:hypothetical protein
MPRPVKQWTGKESLPANAAGRGRIDSPESSHRREYVGNIDFVTHNSLGIKIALTVTKVQKNAQERSGHSRKETHGRIKALFQGRRRL